MVRTRCCPTISFRLCRHCSNDLFHNKDKFTEGNGGGKVKIQFELCQACVGRNIQISDLTSDYRPPHGPSSSGAGLSTASALSTNGKEADGTEIMVHDIE
jgi:hypothetical protein